jgi:glycosyltransferase involved in cell wall biosynthesis
VRLEKRLQGVKMPKISVFIPVYNAEEYLRRCLGSVVNQTLEDIEIICVDDKSTDGSLKILREYEAKDKRFRIIAKEKNGGESVARNTALALAKGEYVGSVDNDDELDLDFFEKLYALAKETGADIAKGKMHEIDYSGKSAVDNSLNEKINFKGKLYFWSQWWTAIYRNEMIRENKIEFQNVILGGDLVFLNRAVLAANKVVATDCVQYNYFRREDSGDSKELSHEKIASALGIYETIIDNINSSDIPRDALYDYIFGQLIANCLVISFRCPEIDTKMACAKTAIAIYAKHEIKGDVRKNLFAQFPAVWNLIESGDVQGITNVFVKYDTATKFSAANLVDNLRQRVKDKPNG